VEAVRDEEVKLRAVGFVKEVGLKPGVINLSTNFDVSISNLYEDMKHDTKCGKIG